MNAIVRLLSLARNCSMIDALARARMRRARSEAGRRGRHWPLVIALALACTLAAPASAQQQKEERKAESPDSALDEIRRLGQSGEGEKAAGIARAAAAAAEKEFGADSPGTARRLYQIGRTLREAGQFAAAEPYLLKALPVYERQSGGKPTRDLAGVLDELGQTSVHTMKLAPARSYFLRALEMKETLFGADSTEVAQILQGLALTGLYASEFGASALYAERALEILQKLRGPGDDPTWATKVILASALLKQGQHRKAGPLVEELLAEEQARPAPDERKIVNLLSMLAGVLLDRGEFAEAEKPAGKGLAILERTGTTHGRDYFNLLSMLAQIHLQLHRLADAEAAAQKVIRAYGVAPSVTARDLMTAASTLGSVYAEQARFADAEQAMKKALAIAEERFGENGLDTAAALDNLTHLFALVERPAEALELFGRILRIRTDLLPPDHAQIGATYVSRAAVQNALRRPKEAEADAREGLRIVQAAYGPAHPLALVARDRLGTALRGLGRLDEATQIYDEAIRLTIEAEGATSQRLAMYRHNLAFVHADAGRYAEAVAALEKSIAGRPAGSIGEAASRRILGAVYVRAGRPAEARQSYRRATALFVEAFKRSAGSRGGYEGGAWLSSTASEFLSTLLGASDMTPAEQTAAGSEAFEVAQWMLRTTTSASLAQMGARLAASDAQLARSVRARQDLVLRWQSLNTAFDRLISQPIADRNHVQADTVRNELANVEARLAAFEKTFAKDFPEYVELSSPSPLSADEVRKLLKPGEALVQIMPLEEQTVIWVVTETGVVMRRLAAPAEQVAQRVASLRCGLDYDGAWGVPGSRCAESLDVNYTAEDREAGKPLPFDIARAHNLYEALLGGARDLIHGKHLLVVSSGALAQLPPHVLVQSLPEGVTAGELAREVALLGAELRDLTDEERRQARIEGTDGVLIVNPVPGGAAERAGLKVGDILLAVQGTNVTTTPQAVQTVRLERPRAKIKVAIWRESRRLEVDVELGAKTIKEWRPLFLDPAKMRDVAWLGRTHAITVLPAVSSLKALRRNARPSRAERPYLGVGNPLLDGPDQSYSALSAAARERQQCGQFAPVTKIASAQGRSVRAPLLRRGNIADVADLRRAAPLPETADELCDVARVLGAVEGEVLLGARAREPEIMRLSDGGWLRNYRILHFATHGALAGEVSGTAEPGLLLTPPEKGSTADDGYLSAPEISSLKLDADWIILSACNTAAGQAADAEALSGLARAFFYAGARALLVSHWYVDSSATVALVKAAFAQIKADPGLGRAEAVRRAMLGLIESGDGTQAHPSAWAPFVVVGEGSAVN